MCLLLDAPCSCALAFEAKLTPIMRKQAVVDIVQHGMKSDRATAVYDEVMRKDPNIFRDIACKTTPPASYL